MAAKLYIRPMARIGPWRGSDPAPRRRPGLTPGAHEEGAGVPVLDVGGRSDLLFSAIEIIERDGGRIRREVRLADGLQWTGADPQGLTPGAPAGLPELLDRVRRPRPAIAGLTLDRPRIMGIVNVTPDSFSDGGR